VTSPNSGPSERLRAALSWPASRVSVVLDTDTFNEIDDQFALVYAMLSPERIALQAVYAAPFHNKRSAGPGDGMERSFEEINRVLERLESSRRPPVFRGATAWLIQNAVPPVNAAVTDLIARARARTERDGPLYVVAIAAITNVAAALQLAPDIKDRIVVLWLGGHPLTWKDTRKFNLQGDPVAARIIFDSGVPLLLFPCRLVAEMLITTVAEMEANVRRCGKIGEYLTQIFVEYPGLTERGASKTIWDLAPLAWLMDGAWAEWRIEPSPVLRGDLTWARDGRRHPIGEVIFLHRDRIFRDLFAKLEKHSQATSTRK